MWIRNQDKKHMFKSKGFSVANMHHSNETQIWCENWLIGTYATEERCIEILDEIQNFISEIEHARYAGYYDSETPSFIYQMPEK